MAECSAERQRAQCLQAVILYEARELPPEERTGYIDRGEKRGACGSDTPSVVEPLAARLPLTELD